MSYAVRKVVKLRCLRQRFHGTWKTEEKAKQICGALKARLEKEDYGQAISWKGVVTPRKANLIIGKAIHPVKTVHPEEWPTVRVYLEDEMKRAAESMSDAQLLLDHEQPLDGEVIIAWYDNGALEFLAEINDQKVLRWIRDGTIRHCNVEYNWDKLERVNGVAPRGIMFTGLSLLKNYEPGDPYATVELWEAIIKRLEAAKDAQAGKSVPNNQEIVNFEKLFSAISSLKEYIERYNLALQSRLSALEGSVTENRRLGEAVIDFCKAR
ncbi:hypothetical protein KEJ18_04145 [Candidatus Bathyarchaeota archaeon]|nr:hypothetical protein [Candidatus Bathyarchaeota archaeon]